MRDIRVLVADDHDATAETLRDLLEADFQVVAVVRDGEALVAAARALRPDVIVTDISMPRRSGICAAAEIIEEDGDARIVILTVHDDPALVDRSLAVGVLGYVLKHAAGEELAMAVREAFGGRRYLSPTCAGAGRQALG